MNYQEDRKQKDNYEKISRSDFLKYTGAIIFVVGGGYYVPAVHGSKNLIKVDEKLG